MERERMFKKPALIRFVVEELHKKSPDKQIGKNLSTEVLLYTQERKILDLDYRMYYYGPYSSDFASEINFANDKGLIGISWKEDEGFFIESKTVTEDFNVLIDQNEIDAVEELIDEFRKYNAKEMSIIATAYYLLDNFETDKSELAEIILSLKPYLTAEGISRVLKDEGIIE